MLLPTHNLKWRARWVEITDSLEALLNEETPSTERVIELLRERQQHLTAFSRIKPDTVRNGIPQQIAWLEEMQERDSAVLAKVSAFIQKSSRALTSYQSNKRALKRLRRKNITPQRHYIVTGHL